MAILKIEVVEGETDIVYRNPYDQVVVVGDSPTRLKQPDALANCLIVAEDETISFHGAKVIYLAIPSFPKQTELNKEEVAKMWHSGEGMIKNPIKKEK